MRELVRLRFRLSFYSLEGLEPFVGFFLQLPLHASQIPQSVPVVQAWLGKKPISSRRCPDSRSQPPPSVREHLIDRDSSLFEKLKPGHPPTRLIGVLGGL